MLPISLHLEQWNALKVKNEGKKKKKGNTKLHNS